MRFMVHWKIHRDKGKEAIANFAGLDLDDYKAQSGPDVHVIGRWHDVLTLTGVVIAEADTAEALGKWLIPWHPLCDFEIVTAMTDEEAHALAQEMTAEG